MKPLRKLTHRVFSCLGLLFIVGWFGGGCQTAKDDLAFSPAPEDCPDSICRYAPGDTIVIRFPDAFPYETCVKEDGTIVLPLIGKIEAAGKTTDELQQVIHDLYVPRYYKSLTFSVPRRVYYVTGQVRSPGRREYIGPITVLKAIISADGFTEFAARSQIVLTRADGKKFKVNCTKVAKDPSLDLPVYPGDKIEVPGSYVFQH